MSIFKILENVDPGVNEFNPPQSFWIGMGILIAILTIPWIALFVYAIVQKYRLYIFSDGFLIKTYKLKANEVINIEYPKKEGYEVEGIYRDDTFVLPFEYKVMPKKNIKIYIKWKKVE